eukprot:gnl/Spiro4/14473_TR7804_c0_g1_i1.p1 gnl/Spiro4/14473_TR7804_c0_g1~~gnl/Spiro4/14473_TR7804_c0_g1_i1.p1  ORF type:complete len:525 (-),score=118.52 gnl/Spiro4/14473_TR7804_c0_g1_i1:120-1694(-)
MTSVAAPPAVAPSTPTAPSPVAGKVAGTPNTQLSPSPAPAATTRPTTPGTPTSGITGRDRAPTFVEVGANQDPAQAAQIKAQQEEQIWNEQKTLHQHLCGEWVYKGKFGPDGKVVKVPKANRQVFEISMNPSVAEYQKKKDAKVAGLVKPTVECVVTAKAVGDKPRRYLNAIQTKPDPWRYATVHVLAPSEVPCIVPPPMLDRQREKEEKRRKEIEHSSRKAGKKVTINQTDKNTKDVPPHPNVRIMRGEFGYPESDLIMNIGTTTVYGQLDAKMNYMKVLFSWGSQRDPVKSTTAATSGTKTPSASSAPTTPTSSRPTTPTATFSSSKPITPAPASKPVTPGPGTPGTATPITSGAATPKSGTTTATTPSASSVPSIGRPPAGVEYGVFQRATKYTGPDRFKCGRLDWQARLGLVVAQRQESHHTNRTLGVVISHVHLGSPAMKAGFKAFDHIISVDDHKVTMNSDLKVALTRLPIGVPIAWKVTRMEPQQLTGTMVCREVVIPFALKHRVLVPTHDNTTLSL